MLGDGVAFAGVAKYPARVKCALLPWMAFKDAAARAGVGVEPGGEGMTERDRLGDERRRSDAPADGAG